MITEGEALPEGEEGMGKTGMESEEGPKGIMVVKVAVLRGAVIWHGRSEVDLGTVRDEVYGSKGCEGFGRGMVNMGEVGTEVGEDGTDVADGGTGNEELAAGEEGKGEVMRGMGDDGWGEKGKVED